MSVPQPFGPARTPIVRDVGRWHVGVFGAVLAIAALIHVPGLWAPLILDDYAQRAMAHGDVSPRRSAFDLYNFIDDGDRAFLFDCGAIPWWTNPPLTLRFLRPLSSALVWLDIRAFGYGSFGAHLHSLLWWAAAVAATYALLRALVNPRAALLGAAAFAVAPSQAPPLLWVANRDVLVATAFGTAGLLLYARWRDRRRPADAVLSGLMFGAAVLAGEYALCFAGYVFAMELVRRKESVLRRLTGGLPFAVPATAYIFAFIGLHYGTRGSGFYRSPLDDMASYALGAPRRAAVLVSAAWFGFDDVYWGAQPQPAAILLGLGTIAVLAVPLWRVLRGLDERTRSQATWMLAGSVLALLPVLAAEPSIRVLDVSMVGVSGLVGLLLDRAAHRGTDKGSAGRDVTVVVAIALGLAHYVRGPVDTVRAIRQYIEAVTGFDKRTAWLREHLDRTKSTVLVLRADSPPATLWMPFMLRDWAPAHWRVLTFRAGLMTAVRRGPRTLEITSRDHPLFPTGPFDLFRNTDELHSGDVVEVPGMRATLLQVDDQHAPKQVRLDFDVDLDDSSVQTISERESGFEEVALPAVNFGVRLVQ